MASSCQESNPRHLAGLCSQCFATELRTTTGQPPALTISYMYCTAGGIEMPQSHTWQPLSMCRQWHILSGTPRLL